MEEDKTFETIDSTNDEDQEDEIDLDLESSFDDDEKLTRLQEQNKKLFERAKKAEGFEKQADGTWKKREKPQEVKPVQKNNISENKSTKPSDILKADEFKLYRQGYSEEEIDLIMHNGGMEALKNEKSPLVLGLKASQEQQRAEQASGVTTDKAGQSEVERKYTPEQMKNMKADELANLIGYADGQ